jgi:hypothetical protein
MRSIPSRRKGVRNVRNTYMVVLGVWGAGASPPGSLADTKHIGCTFQTLREKRKKSDKSLESLMFFFAR